jgi:hypothetical protein
MITVEQLINETVEAIETGVRTDGSPGPIQYWHAAEQVLISNNVHEKPGVHAYLYKQAVVIAGSGEVMDLRQLMRKGLTEFIGTAARQRMGARYDHLLFTRLGPVPVGAE